MRHVSLVAVIAAFVASNLAAAAPLQGLYIDIGAGADIAQDQIVKPFGGYGPTKRSYTFDPGPATIAGLGYGFGNGFRIEAQGDYLDIHVRGVHADEPERAGGHEQQYGGFLNVLHDFDLNAPVIPYLGVGAGYQAVELDRINSGAYTAIGGGLTPETNGAFAYQGIAGFALPIGFITGLSLIAEYHFIGILTPSPYVRGNGEKLDYRVVDGDRETYRATFGNIFNHEALLGIRYAFGAPPAPSLAPPVSTEPAAPTMPPSRSYLVFFDWDRADLTARARQIVVEAAQASTHVQTTRIEVNGYTDLSGTATYNQKLSIRRGQSVEAELIRDGVPQGEISVHGYGESNPLVQTRPGVREPQNRRVEIILR